MCPLFPAPVYWCKILCLFQDEGENAKKRLRLLPLKKFCKLELFFKSNNINTPFVHFVPPVSVHVIRRCGAMLKSGLAVSC